MSTLWSVWDLYPWRLHSTYSTSVTLWEPVTSLMTTSDSSFCEIKYKYFKGNYTLKLCSIGSSFKCNRGTSEWPGSLVATPRVTRRIRRHGVDCLCCSQWLMQMQWQVTPLNFAPFLFCGLFQKNQRRPAQPDLPDRLRVRRWKGVSMTATLIQPAPGY